MTQHPDDPTDGEAAALEGNTAYDPNEDDTEHTEEPQVGRRPGEDFEDTPEQAEPEEGEQPATEDAPKEGAGADGGDDDAGTT